MQRPQQKPELKLTVIAGLLGLTLLTACGVQENSGERKMGSKPGNISATKSVDANGKTVSSDPDQAAADGTPAEVEKSMKVLVQAHQIFRQIWNVAPREDGTGGVSGGKEDPGSPFKAVGALLKEHAADGWDDASSDNCEASLVVHNGTFVQLAQKVVKNVTVEYKVDHTCAAANAADDTDPSKYSETWFKLTWTLDDANNGNRDLAVEFHRSHLGAGFGPSLAARASMAQDKDTVSDNSPGIPDIVRCKLIVDASTTVTDIKDCAGMGQNLKAANGGGRRYFEFTKFQYSKATFQAEQDYGAGDGSPSVVKKGTALMALAIGNEWEAKDSGYVSTFKTLAPVPTVGTLPVYIEVLTMSAQEEYDREHGSSSATGHSLPKSTEGSDTPAPNIKTDPVTGETNQIQAPAGGDQRQAMPGNDAGLNDPSVSANGPAASAPAAPVAAAAVNVENGKPAIAAPAPAPADAQAVGEPMDAEDQLADTTEDQLNRMGFASPAAPGAEDAVPEVGGPQEAAPAAETQMAPENEPEAEETALQGPAAASVPQNVPARRPTQDPVSGQALPMDTSAAR